MKTILGFLAISLAASTGALADSHHDSHHNGGHYSGGNYGHRGGPYHGGRGGRFYYYGGVPYFYPIAGFGFGDPYWYGGGFGGYGGYGYDGYGSIDDRYYGYLRPYEGRIVDETAPGRIPYKKARDPSLERCNGNWPSAAITKVALMVNLVPAAKARSSASKRTTGCARQA